MKVIVFNGNLGNQVFYCAFKLYIESKYKNEKVYMYIRKGCPKVRVADCFELDLPQRIKFGGFIIAFILFIDNCFRTIFHWSIFNSIICGNSERINERALIFTNYLQDNYYYRDLPSNWLRVRKPQKKIEQYLYYKDLINNTNSISVHVRRGDYIGTIFTDLASTDYYDKAIAYAKSLIPDGELFFFSDDLNFVKERYGNFEKAHFVDCNRDEYSYLDIELMSHAKVNIMANSSFSYWGAYMNHENKTVIYPKNWFVPESKRQAPNIVLSNWVGV